MLIDLVQASQDQRAIVARDGRVCCLAMGEISV